MNAHQLYAHNLVTSLTAADIAHFYDPAPETTTEPGKRRRVHAEPEAGDLEELHATVLLYADGEIRRNWSRLIADAVKEPRGNKPAMWALRLARLLQDIPQEDAPEARQLELVAD